MRTSVDVARARELSTEGWSMRAIATELGVRPQTVSRWCGGIRDLRQGAIVEAFQRKRESFLTLDHYNKRNISIEQARLYSSLLYWCEGSKYPSSTTVAFTGSDPKLMEFFINLFRIGYSPIESRFRVWVQFHSDQNNEMIINYWSTLLGIPTSQFIKPNVTVKKGGKYRRVYYGTCSIRYGDYSLILRMMGLYTRFANNLKLKGVK